MNTISVFAMTKRGHIVISEIIKEFGSSFINLVIAAKDQNLENDYYDEIKTLCKNNNIIFRDRKDRFKITTIYCFTIGWRWMIKLDDDKKIIIFHDSILPEYRGFAPVVNSLINGEKRIGVTTLFASGNYDEGDIIYQSATEIRYPIKIEKAIEVNNANYIKCALHVSGLINKSAPIPAFAQDTKEATYSLWRDEEDYRINWNKSAAEIQRFINATGSPYKGAFSTVDGNKIRILDAEVKEDVIIINRDPGKIIFVEEGNPVVICATGLLKVTMAFFDESGKNFIPVKKLRMRFQ